MSRKLHTHAGSDGVNLSLIITPFLDMAFQILAFFIMTYHPSSLEGHIPGSLVPPADYAKKGKETNPNTTEAPLSVPEDDLLAELNDAIQIRVKSAVAGKVEGSRKTGEPTTISYKQAQDANFKDVSNFNVTIEESMAQLGVTLKGIRAQPGSDKTNVKIEADPDLKQGFVMQVYDVCKKSGFTKVHFVPPPVERMLDKDK